MFFFVCYFFFVIYFFIFYLFIFYFLFLFFIFFFLIIILCLFCVVFVKCGCKITLAHITLQVKCVDGTTWSIYNFLSTLKLSILLASTESLENNRMLKKVEFRPFLAQNECFRVPFFLLAVKNTHTHTPTHPNKQTNKQTILASIIMYCILTTWLIFHSLWGKFYELQTDGK